MTNFASFILVNLDDREKRGLMSVSKEFLVRLVLGQCHTKDPPRNKLTIALASNTRLALATGPIRRITETRMLNQFLAKS
jgi:hypothetical protein